MNKVLTLTLALLFTFTGVKAQNKKPEKPVRPKVGLVLSGGGAKGFAYIGLLRVLEEVNLHLDYIAGTSIGSIIGGLYAAGYSPDQMEKIIKSQNWDNLLNDFIDRKYLNFEDKIYGEKYIIDLPLQKKSLPLKASLHEGQQINLMLNKYFSPYYNVKSFDELPTPFLCIGTDLLTGEAVELNSGNLAMAVRSSMSIPGFFSPTYFQGKYLIDGGVINNFPVVNVKNKGVEYVIGGDVQQGLTKDPNELNTIAKILDQVVSFSRVAANKEAYKNTDMLIKFNVKYGMMDFNEYDSIIAYGEKVARDHYGQLKAFADSLNAIKPVPVRKHNTKPLDSLFISKIEVEGLENLSNKFMMNFFKGISEKKIALKNLEERITAAYGTNYFDHIFYELKPSDKGVILVLKIKEKSMGTLRASIHYDNDYLGSLKVGATVRNLLPATKIYVDLVLGPSPRFRSLFLVDNGKVMGLGAKLNYYNFNFDVYERDKKIDKIQFVNHSASLFANKTLKNYYNFRAGIQYEYFKFNYEYDTTDYANNFNEFRSYGNMFISFRSDTYDNSIFPTKGFRTIFFTKYVFPLSKGWSSDFFSKSLISYLIYDQAVTIGHNLVLKPGVFLGATIKSSERPPLQHYFALGGLNPTNYVESFQPFTGGHFLQKYGLYVATGKLKLQYNFMPKQYITLKTDFGAIDNNLDNIFKPESFLMGYGITYSYDSFIGPIEFTMMGSNFSDDVQFFVNIGFWF